MRLILEILQWIALLLLFTRVTIVHALVLRLDKCVAQAFESLGFKKEER